MGELKPMDAKAKRKVIADMLAELQRDMMAAIEQMPDDWDETELGWYLVHRAEMFHRTADRLRCKAYENALRTRGATGPVGAPWRATATREKDDYGEA
jgi:hypothetical protein